MNKLIHAITEQNYAPAKTLAFLNITKHEHEYIITVRSRGDSSVSNISLSFDELKILCIALLAEVQK